MCFTELAFAAAAAAIPAANLLELKSPMNSELRDSAIELIGSLGAFTVLNYEKLLEQAMAKRH